MVKKKKTNISVKIQLFIATGVVLLLVCFGLFVGWLDSNMNINLTDKTQTASFNDVTLKGKTVCISPQGNGPQPAVCAIGLKTTGGSIYAIGGEAFPVMDAEVELTGVLSSISKNETRDIAGILTVK